jgi:autotransporter adhesin
MNQTSMFTRARLQMPLTPAERSFLKFIQGAIVTVLVAAIAAGLPFVEQQQVNWRTVITITVGTFVATLASMVQKYFSAQGDGGLATLAGDVGTVVSQKAGLNDLKQPS